MSRWSVAHSIAHIAAQQARGDAGWEPDQRADVIELIESCDVQVFGGPGSRLFGAFLPGDSGRKAGVWLNAGLSVTGQRHTAGHEWGHYTLRHGEQCGLSIDDLATDAAAGMRRLNETAAEAFAAWLLMPRAALATALRTLGCARGTIPSQVQCYETALVLGVSYRGTARHLATARLVDQQVSRALMRGVPGRIKKSLDELAAPPASPRAEVWRLAHFTGFDELVVSAGDRLIIDHSDEGAIDALLGVRRAELVTETNTVVVLTALGQTDRMTVPPVEITLGGRPVGIRIDQPVVGLANADSVPDISTLTPEELMQLR